MAVLAAVALTFPLWRALLKARRARQRAAHAPSTQTLVVWARPLSAMLWRRSMQRILVCSICFVLAQACDLVAHMHGERKDY